MAPVRDLHRRRVGVTITSDDLDPKALSLERDLLPSFPSRGARRVAEVVVAVPSVDESS